MLDFNLNPQINIPDFRKRAAVEIKGNGEGWASETEGDLQVIGKNGKKEHTVFMVGHWSAQFDQEMLGVQDWMIVDIGKSNK